MAWRRRRSVEERLACDLVEQVARRPNLLRPLLIIGLIALLIWAGWQLWQQHLQKVSPAVVTTSPSTIRIATWNLRKFSERSGVGQHPPDLVEIASIIKSARFDLIAIQEVQREGQVVEKLRRQLNEPWRHVVSERTGNNERYAFLYRSDRVELVDGSAKLLGGPDVVVFDRAPFVASFRCGQFDFMLLTVHLSFADIGRRKSEAESLRRIATQLGQVGAEHDVIVLGDFNEQHQRPNLQLFEQWGWKKLNEQTTNLGSSEVYDNILIDPKFTKEWTGQAGTWRFDETDFANDDKAASELVSDHRPAWAEFSTAGPDDD